MTPPAGTPTFDPSENRSEREDQAPPAIRSCCAKKAAESAVVYRPERSCCSAKSADRGEPTCCESQSDEAADSDEAPAGVVLLQAMKCRGVASSWTGTGQPFVPPIAIEWEQETTVSPVVPTPEPVFACCRPRYVGPPG